MTKSVHIPMIMFDVFEMDSSLENLIRKVANLPEHLQVELFREVARFPAITLPVLEMTGNEIASVFESSRKVPLEEPSPLPESGAGWGVTTRAKGKKQVAETETDDDEDEQEEEATSEEERAKVKRREAKRVIFHAIPQLGLTFSVCPQLHVTPLSHIRVVGKHLACCSHIV